MTADLLAELQAAFPAGATSGTLPLGAIGHGEYGELLSGLGIPATLAATSASGWQQSGDGALAFSGNLTTTVLGLENADVGVTLTPAGTDDVLTVQLWLPPTWTFPQSFASLGAGVFTELTLDSASRSSLTVASAATSTAERGLSIHATLAVGSSIVTQIAWLIDGDTPPVITGAIDYDATHGTVEFVLTLATGTADGLFGTSPATKLELEIDLWSGLNEALDQYESGLRFTATIDFPTQDNADETVTLTALLWHCQQGVLELGISGSALAFPKPATLEQYLGASNGITDALPAQFQDLTLVTVDGITLGIGLQSKSLEFAFLTVGVAEGQVWKLWPGVLELDEIQLRFAVFQPFGQAAYAFTFIARLDTLGIPLVVQAQLPAEVLSATLDPTLSAPSVAGLLEKVVGSDRGVPADVVIDELSLGADLEQGYYDASVEIDGNWSIPFGTDNTVDFQDLRLACSYTRDTGAAGEIRARLAVAHSDFAVSLDVAGKEVEFRGSWTLQPGHPPLTYQDLALALGMYGLPNPPKQLDLGLAKASFEFDAGPQPEFSFDLETASGGAAALIAGKNTAGAWGFVYGMVLSLDVHVDLTHIDVIGSLVPSDLDSISLSELRVVGATTALPLYTSTPALQQVFGPALSSGLALSTRVEIGTAFDQTLTVRFGGADDGAASDKPPNSSPPNLVATDGGATPSPQATWVSVQRAFGPVQLNRIGFAITPDDALALLLDASVSLAGLTIGLVGLEAAMPLKQPYEPHFDLAGLQVNFTGGPVVIAGGLEKAAGPGPAEYTGDLTLRLPSFGATLLGSYTTTDGKPSLFAFLAVAAPIGGPPCFFVTGLAGGFGYNRFLQLPTIEQVASFPLVDAAINGPGPNTTRDLNTFIRPADGEDWLAAGIRFTSYEMIDSFALLTISWGTQLEFALMGESTIAIPVPAAGETASPTAQVQMVILADYAPDHGVLSVSAQLTPQSYVLSRAAQLTGGFAFYAWFAPSEHEGDFVVTLGGYNSYWTPPAHYPLVPRLGLNWRLSDDLTIKGGLYFAVTPSVLMAGGALEASFQSGDLRAWFDARADFLIRYKPFQYLIDVDVSIGVSLTIDLWITKVRITVHVGVGLRLWGPPFGGTAHIDLSVISFTIHFGSSDSPDLPDVKWEQFRTSFLPPANAGERAGDQRLAAATGPTPTDSVIAISAGGGLLSTLASGPQALWLVDPARLSVTIGTRVPSTTATVVTQTTTALPVSWSTSVGIGPMGVAPGELTSGLAIAVDREGTPDDDVWNATPVTGNVPSGVWRQTSNDLHADALVADALTGVTVVPAPPTPDQTLPVSLDALLDDDPPVLGFAWSAVTAPSGDPFDQSTAMQTLRATIAAPATAAVRTEILAALARQHLDVATSVDVAPLAADAADVLAAPPILHVLGEMP